MDDRRDDDRAVRRLRAAGCVFAEDEVALLRAEIPEPGAFEEALRRREAGEPLEQIVGWAGFDGLRIRVVPGVFVPRLRTTAVLGALRSAASGTAWSLAPGNRVLDLCCGSGALGAAVLARHPRVRIVATDVDPDAVRCARLNLPADSLVVKGDLFAALPPDLLGGFAAVVVNAPYVPTSEIAGMPPEAREHEHLVALDGGVDGLSLHARIARESAPWLRAGGVLLLETSRRQADRTAAFFAGDVWETRVHLDDEVDGTVIVARRR